MLLKGSNKTIKLIQSSPSFPCHLNTLYTLCTIVTVSSEVPDAVKEDQSIVVTCAWCQISFSSPLGNLTNEVFRCRDSPHSCLCAKKEVFHCSAFFFVKNKTFRTETNCHVSNVTQRGSSWGLTSCPINPWR